MKYAYLPGCSLESTAKEYNKSIQAVAEKIGLELIEIPDWNCCGGMVASQTNSKAGLGFSARNLVLADEMGLDVVTPCSVCYNRLRSTKAELESDNSLRAQVSHIMDLKYDGKADIFNIIEVILNECSLENIAEMITKPLKGLRIASYYGCLLAKPEISKIVDQENPKVIDNIMTSLGAETIDWPFKTECCGASLSTPRTDIVQKLSNDILTSAKKEGANCIVTVCPL